MTAANKPPFKQHLGNGVTVDFAAEFRFNAPSHVLVRLIAADGSFADLAYGTDYSVAGGATDAGGTVTMTVPPAVGSRLQVRRATPRVQAMNYATSDTFPAESHEAAIDKAMLVDQEQDVAIGDVTSRALMVPVGEAAPAVPPIDDLKGKILGVDLDGKLYGSAGGGADNGLRADLASATGAALSKTSRGYSVERELTWARAAVPASINEFYDATNGAAAERIALEGAAASGRAVSWRGTLTMDQRPTLPARTLLNGEGSTSDNGTRGRTCIVRGFAGAGPLLLLLDGTTIQNIDVDGDNQGAGDNIQIIGERVTLDNVSTRKAGGHGCWIGDLDNDTMNANCWSIYALKSIYNAGSGLRIHHTNSDTGVTWPIGAANVNAGGLFGADVRSNGSHGLFIGNGVDNKFHGLVVQNNVGSNIYLDDYARGNCLFSPYSELGGVADTLAALSSGNLIIGTSSVVPMPIIDNGTGNVIMRHDPSLKEQVFVDRLGIAPSFASGVGASLDLFNDNLDLAAQVFGEKTGVGSQGKGVATAKRNGNTPADVFEWVHGSGVNILSGVLRVAGTQVVGARQGAIGNAAGGTEVATINAILAALRTHGLIAP
jgi:hypothetical protein